MKYNYAFKSDKENLVKVVGRDLSISTKQAIEICSFIKNMRLEKARSLLEKVRDEQVAIPFMRFTEGAGHKKGLKGAAGGKYPFRASTQFLNLLKSLEANAQNKGLGSELKIIHACAQKASTPLHYGRKRRIHMKRTHVELVAEELEPVRKEKKEGKDKKETKQAPEKALKKEDKKEEKAAEKKVEEKAEVKVRKEEAKKQND